MKRTSASHLLRAGTISLALCIGIVSAPTPAKAIVVFDPSNMIQNTISAVADHWLVLKEGVLDPLGQTAAKVAVQSIMRSTINWANNGFNGSPAYITNLENDMRRFADYEADRFLDAYIGSGNIDSPFRDRVANTLREEFRRSTANNAFIQSSRYTLRTYAPNDEAFVRGDFSQGGLRAWVEAWRNDQNNIFGAIRSARDALNGQVRVSVSNRQTELNWSRGILSWCAEPEASAAATEEGPTSLTPPPPGGSSDCQVQTLGSFTHQRINDVLGADIASLVAADELDEMYAALLSGLANKIISGSGLFGLSQPDSTGRSPLEQAAQGTVATSTASRTTAVISGQIDELERYKSNWTTIKAAADSALAACENSSRDGADESEALARTTISEAEAALARADAALERLTEIRAQLTASAGANTTDAMRAAFAAYDELMASDVMPSGYDIARAATQSQDEAEIQPPTLVYRLNQATRSCGRIF